MKHTMVVAGAAAVAMLAACSGGGSGGGGAGGGTASGGTGPTLKIGVVIPQSGTYASEGGEVRRGYELAIADNAGQMGGASIQLVFGDAFAPADVISETERLGTREKVDAYVGTYATPASQAGSETAAKQKKVWVETHAITDSLTTRKLDNYFRVGARAVDFANASAKFVAEGLAPKLGGKPTVYVEHEDGPYGTSVAQTQISALKAAGFTVTEGKHKSAATDVTDSVLAAKSANPDVWLITGYAPDSGLLLRTAAAQGFKPKATVLTGAGDTKAIYQAVGAKDLTNTFVVAYTSPIVSETYAPGNAKFYAEYKSKYGSEPLGTVANTGYTGMTAFIKMLQATGGKVDIASMNTAAPSINVPLGGDPNGWGLKFDADRQNTLIRLLAVQWREDGTVPAVWPQEAATSGQTMQGLGG